MTKSKMWLIIVFLIATVCGCSKQEESKVDLSAPVPRYVEGVHFHKIKGMPASDTPQLIKFISHFCPACRNFEMTSNLHIPDGVTVERFPVSYGREAWLKAAKSYATLRAMNLHEQFSDELFTALQDEREPLTDRVYFVNWVSRRTAFTPEQIDAAYGHEKTSELVTMYRAAERRYSITSVPTIVINGNIEIDLASMEGDTQSERMTFLDGLANYLLAQ